MSDLREKLADQEHERWSSWMAYLFGKCKVMEGGNLLIPHESVKRWLRQIETPYAELSEKEKDSDRKEADNTLALIDTQLSAYKDVAEAARELCDLDSSNYETQDSWDMDEGFAMLKLHNALKDLSKLPEVTE